MGFRDAFRDAMGSKLRATPASRGGLDLDDLGFDQVNTNDWIRLQLSAREPGPIDPAPVRRLPAGRALAGGWVSDSAGAFSEHWYAIADRFPTAGIWPVLVVEATGAEPGWLTEGTGTAQPVVDDAEALLTRTFRAAADLDGLEPWRSRWLGLADPEPARDQLTGVRPVAGERALLLAPVTRPADLPAALGWRGAEGYEYSGAGVSAVLRSWEDRFGAVLVGLGPDRMRLSVDRPPRFPEQARRLAGEHYGLAPDVIDQVSDGDPEAYAELLFQRREWDLWWS